MSPELHARRRIWITRAQPGAAATAARLEAMGFEPVIGPVLDVRPRAAVDVDLAGGDTLAFTSAAGVSAFAALTTARDLAVFAVGDATAEAARAAGFADVHSARGDAAALADIIAAVAPKPARVLCPGAAAPAADLPRLLADRGVGATALVVYETREAPPEPPPDNLFAILIHSAKAARAVAQRLAGAEISDLTVLAISPSAAAPLAGFGFRRLAIAPRPDEAALMALLEP
jgi:uroporphyrinogen-III synthase